MTRRWPRATLTGTLPTELVAALALRRQSGTRRVLIYSHDTYGLGHLRRSLLIARALSARSPAPSVLLVTGSSRAHAFPRPPGCDIFQLPGIFKRADGTYQARSPDASLAAVLELRSALLHSLARSFAPDMVVVDNVPVGLCGELGAMLKDLRRRRDAPELVLGLRDVLDHPERVQAEWNAAGAWDYLESVYDRILVYGDPRVLTTAQEPDLHTRYAQKLHFTGYVAPPLPDSREDVSGLPSIVVTPGGGGDGQRLLRAYATALERERSPLPVRSVIILGPFLSASRRTEITRRLERVPHAVTLVRFTDQMEQLIASASGAISMAGYNTIVETLAAGVPALVVPRERPRQEQRIRAERLREHADIAVEAIHPELPDRINAFLHEVTQAAMHRRPGFDLRLNGMATIGELLGSDAPTCQADAPTAPQLQTVG